MAVLLQNQRQFIYLIFIHKGRQRGNIFSLLCQLYRQLSYIFLLQEGNQRQQGLQIVFGVFCYLFHLAGAQYLGRLLQLLLGVFCRLYRLPGGYFFHYRVAAAQDFIHRHTKNFGQFRQLGNIGHGIAPLPVGNSLIADAHAVCQFKLCHILFLAQLRYSFADSYRIKHIVWLLSVGRSRHHQHNKLRCHAPAISA